MSDLAQLDIPEASAWAVTVGEDMANCVLCSSDKQEVREYWEECIGENGRFEGIYRLRALRFCDEVPHD